MKRPQLHNLQEVPSFRRLQGYQVSTGGGTVELLIRGFANEMELASFVLKLREMGLLVPDVNGVPGVIDEGDD